MERSKPLLSAKQIIEYYRSEFGKLEQGDGRNADVDESLYCRVCEKLFAKESVYQAHLHGQKHQKALSKFALDKKLTPFEEKKGLLLQRPKQILWLEFLIRKYVTNILSEEVSTTKGNIERKQSRTSDELLEDVEEGLEDDEDSSVLEEELTRAQEEKLYNPLKLPLGWDGKPIPYWLYKLHGLGVSYPCEICGNYVYMGRKAFDKHFQVSSKKERYFHLWDTKDVQ